MNQHFTSAFDGEMQLTIDHFQLKNYDVAYRHVERAHILGQRFFIGHWRTHYWMLRIALTTSDRREAIGQIVRLFAVIPGFVFGWVPVGNTGRATVSAIAPMPIPDDLRAYFEGYDLKSIIAKRALLAIIIGLGALAI
jgi:arylesterase / paraoxonase